MKRLLSTVSLFASTSTLLCCALPALFVALGAGSVFAGLVSAVPQLTWLSEHKALTFGLAASLLLVSSALQISARRKACPSNPALADACRTTRSWGGTALWLSCAFFCIGAFFAFVPSLLG